MKHFALRLTTQSPLAIRADHAPTGSAGSRYIPGSTLLGALASLYRQFYHGQTALDMFAPLFLNEQVCYSNLYPAVFDDAGMHGSDLPVYPLPKTAQSCKRHPGFLCRFIKGHDAHGMRDTLIDHALFALTSAEQQSHEQRLAIIRDKHNCMYKECGEAMDHLDGYYRRDDLDEKIDLAHPERYSQLQTRTGIDRATGTVQEGILYNRQVFEEDMQFWGQISVHEDEELLNHLETFIEDIGHAGLLRLGTGRTRGLGKVTLALTLFDHEQTSFTTFNERLASFNKRLHDRARAFAVSIPYDTYFFSITLHSPLILHDDLLRYQSAIPVDILQEGLQQRDIAFPDLKRIFYASDIQRVAGWQDLWGTPRTTEYAIESGSVFLFSCSSPPNEEQLRALFTLQEQGLGKRRIEGFGRIGLSDQFHQYIKQQE